MRRIYIGLTVWNLAVLAAVSVLAVLPGIPPRTHALAGLFSVVFACLTHSLLLVHFIGSMWWMRQEATTSGLGDVRSLRTAWVRGRAFPMVVAAAFLAVATGISGKDVEPGTLGGWVHVVLGVANLPVTAWVLRLAVRGIDANDERMRKVHALAEARRERGEAPAASDEALRPESGRAGGKVFLWLAGNVWLLWLYLRVVLRREDPLWPFVAASAGLLVLGLALLRSSREA
jgi:hypothetical protein